jgi:hypothetical protein
MYFARSVAQAFRSFVPLMFASNDSAEALGLLWVDRRV